MRADTEVIFNPAGGRGAARALLPQIVASFSALGIRVSETRGHGDEEQLARDALARNVTTLIAAGGDGTCSNVANAILRAASPCTLAVIPAGTGNDFAKMLGVLDMPVAGIADLVDSARSTSIDVGRADERFFINSCGFGFDPSVLEATKSVPLLKGDALYIYAALKQLFNYRGVRVAIDTEPDENQLMLTVSNGQYLGGAFRIAPEASALDGKLDVCAVRDAGVAQRARLFAAAFRGTHGRLRAVRMFRTSQMSLTFPAPPSIEVDGELRRARSNRVTIECLPRALNVIAAPGARL